MSRRILFIVEGERAEPRFLKKIIGCYDIADDHNIYSVATNIHVVYDRLFTDNEEDDLDLLTSLKEGSTEDEKQILSQKYSDIYLIFDAEVQDTNWNPLHIKRMLDYFDDPTENGMLLLNYPMFESIRHMSAPGDPEYLRSTITIEQARHYKSLVGSEGCLELRTPNKYNKEIIGMLLHMNIWKLGIILKSAIKQPDYTVYNRKSLMELFDKQTAMIEKDGKLFVINTSVMIVLEFISPSLFTD